MATLPLTKKIQVVISTECTNKQKKYLEIFYSDRGLMATEHI